MCPFSKISKKVKITPPYCILCSVYYSFAASAAFLTASLQVCLQFPLHQQRKLFKNLAPHPRKDCQSLSAANQKPSKKVELQMVQGEKGGENVSFFLPLQTL